MMDDQGDLWVFGYGSLMWRPGFDFADRRPASVKGFHRALCIYSFVHRGTREAPGLVLGLDRGGSCKGVAFRVEAARREATIAYLRERELVTSVYLEAQVRAAVEGIGAVPALSFVVDRRHAQYAGRLPREELPRFIRQGVGVSGDNADYVRNTHDHLVKLGIRDAELAWLCQQLEETPQAISS